MTTLIAAYRSDGTCLGRCDARCHDALEPRCDCICGGRNHGAGLERAVENTRELAESWLDEAAKRAGLPRHALKIEGDAWEPYQRTLPGLEGTDSELYGDPVEAPRRPIR